MDFVKLSKLHEMATDSRWHDAAQLAACRLGGIGANRKAFLHWECRARKCEEVDWPLALVGMRKPSPADKERLRIREYWHAT
jgi:hypothetical protein